MFLESTQNQRCFNVEFYRWINVDKSTLNQRGYHVDRRRDVISTYINVESTLIVCWVRVILLNIYVFNLMNFRKFCSLLATFVNAQETIQRGLNVVARVIWRRNVEQCETNVEAKLLMSTLKFATFNNVYYFNVIYIRQRWNNAVIFNVEFHNVETTLWIWQSSKKWK